jgi:hypothetical protein
MHVANVCFKCFRYFRGMLQTFYMNVAKVDRDVAYVAMVVHVCYKLLFLFHLFFRCILQVFLFECCICFRIYVASVLSGCCVLQWFSSAF